MFQTVLRTYPLASHSQPEGGYTGCVTRRKQAHCLPWGQPNPKSHLISWCSHTPLIASHCSPHPTFLPGWDTLGASVTPLSYFGAMQGLASMNTVDRRARRGCGTSIRGESYSKSCISHSCEKLEPAGGLSFLSCPSLEFSQWSSLAWISSTVFVFALAHLCIKLWFPQAPLQLGDVQLYQHRHEVFLRAFLGHQHLSSFPRLHLGILYVGHSSWQLLDFCHCRSGDNYSSKCSLVLSSDHGATLVVCPIWT